jgi:SAM-dependent methyltransferase
MKRSYELEMMDLAVRPQELLAGELKNLRRLNRYLGGYRGVEAALAELVRQQPLRHLSLLDVGTGSADIPGRIVRWCRRRGIGISIVALDLDPFTAQLAAEHPPFAPGSFDVVLASQFLHHFSEANVVALLKSWACLARRAVIVSDLLRHSLAYYGVRLITRLCTTNVMTRTDAPLSIERSFTVSEWRDLCRRAARDDFRLMRVFPFRVVARLQGAG